MALVNDLRFGYRAPSLDHREDIDALWGGRWIFPDDQVWDRQDAVGSDEGKSVLLGWLSGGAGAAASSKARELAESGELGPGADKEVVLYEDSAGRILGNPQASHGYLYVVAYLTNNNEGST